MSSRLLLRSVSLLATASALAVLAACGGGDTPSTSATTTAPPMPGAASATPPAPGTPATSTASVPSAGPTSDWTSGPLTVEHDVAVPPVPVLTGIRSAAHSDEGFDRIVFDIDGAIPGYQVRYVSSVVRDPSGLPVTMPGRRYLQVTFSPAQAHTDTGSPTVPTKPVSLNYPMLRGYTVTGDFEGVVTVTLGLDDVVAYRVGELTGRIYLDVAA